MHTLAFSLLYIIIQLLGASLSYSFGQPLQQLSVPNVASTQKRSFPLFKTSLSDRYQPSHVPKSLICDELNTVSSPPQLTAAGLMICGALARSASVLALHPLHALKVNLQSQPSRALTIRSLLSSSILTRGLGAQLLLTLPHGALNFALTETAKKWLRNYTAAQVTDETLGRLDPALDLLAASVATVVCSVISIPQMLMVDRIMVGVYPSLSYGVLDVTRAHGLLGLYQGWLPGMLVKLPSSALTWMFYQQLRQRVPVTQSRQRQFRLAAVASAASCVLTVPMDTVKTRLITQKSVQPGGRPVYIGVRDCFRQIVRTEGWTSLFSSLPPRLLASVPMMSLQFAVFEALKTAAIARGWLSVPEEGGVNDDEHLQPVDMERRGSILKTPSVMLRGGESGRDRSAPTGTNKDIISAEREEMEHNHNGEDQEGSATAPTPAPARTCDVV